VTETIPEMRARHKAEVKAALVEQAEMRISQTEAARNLDMKLTGLNNLVIKLDIYWPVKMQGKYDRSKK
jgi:hypothetical protein